MPRFYGIIIKESDHGETLNILAVGPEMANATAPWEWCDRWVERNKPEGTIRKTVWREAELVRRGVRS